MSFSMEIKVFAEVQEQDHTSVTSFPVMYLYKPHPPSHLLSLFLGTPQITELTKTT